MPKVYLAARYSRRPEMLQVAQEVRALGHEVTSRWINGGHQISDDQLQAVGLNFSLALAERYALEDIADLLRATYCIFFTEAPRNVNSRGGRHVEFGIAIREAKHCWVIGPRENIFYCLDNVRVFERWDEALECLKQLA